MLNSSANFLQSITLDTRFSKPAYFEQETYILQAKDFHQNISSYVDIQFQKEVSFCLHLVNRQVLNTCQENSFVRTFGICSLSIIIVSPIQPETTLITWEYSKIDSMPQCLN